MAALFAISTISHRPASRCSREDIEKTIVTAPSAVREYLPTPDKALQTIHNPPTYPVPPPNSEDPEKDAFLAGMGRIYDIARDCARSTHPEVRRWGATLKASKFREII